MTLRATLLIWRPGVAGEILQQSNRIYRFVVREQVLKVYHHNHRRKPAYPGKQYFS